MQKFLNKKSSPTPPNWRIRRASKIIIISISAILIVAGAVLIWRLAMSPDVAPKTDFGLNNFVLPEEIVLAGESIPLTWTDDNTGENLIIQSDRRYYDGRDSSEVYFSITNASGQDQDIVSYFHFEDGTKGVRKIYALEDDEWKPLKIENLKIDCKL